ncbi:hypothetical protein [Shewanella litoralis]|uniref:Uncharacterized protein n=1 Tax=Shewanella litoralis TaxID=2282700 RepID=A0ABQ2R623_9GAMM|nr:hypothetical protein [Shewanella litoralis]GGQ15714.1 hypothetical protein GCM10009411_15130 [Shewanella litoralis]
MARLKHTIWNRYKYKINGLILVLVGYFLYQSLFPQFPDALPTQALGAFEVTPIPYNVDAPYLHDGTYTKDFLLLFSKGQVNTIRQAYLTIGTDPLPLATLQLGDAGILHGSQHGQEVHALAPEVLLAEHKIWLTIENWQGQQQVTSWALPEVLYSPH